MGWHSSFSISAAPTLKDIICKTNGTNTLNIGVIMKSPLLQGTHNVSQWSILSNHKELNISSSLWSNSGVFTSIFSKLLSKKVRRSWELSRALDKHLNVSLFYNWANTLLTFFDDAMKGCIRWHTYHPFGHIFVLYRILMLL